METTIAKRGGASPDVPRQLPLSQKAKKGKRSGRDKVLPNRGSKKEGKETGR